MFGNKRLAKRSIIGTRVSALFSQDGRFYPAMIQAQVSEQTITSKAVYAVRFDDGGTQHCKSRNIVGHGFQSITSVTLVPGQKVFLTMNGREVSGKVARHDSDQGDVLVNIRNSNGEEFAISRRLEDIRLLESRKSARLESQQTTDYSKLADLQLSDSTKRRVASHVIDVPAGSQEKNDTRYVRHRYASGDRSDSDDDDNIEMMDETVAAMVLTSLSVSPKSPPMSTHFNSKDVGHAYTHTPYPDTHLSSSVASSGFYSGHSERDDHSPPMAPLSESAPPFIGYPNPPSPGDDSSNSSGRLHICEDQSGVSFVCTWRGCKHTSTSSDTMERHIRRVHFDRDSDLEMTDNEEEFHYTEVDNTSRSINTMTKSFAALHTSSPHTSSPLPSPLEPNQLSLESRHRHLSADNVSSQGHTKSHVKAIHDTPDRNLFDRGVFDHDYQMKMSKISRSTFSVLSSVDSNTRPTTLTSSLPINISGGQIQKSLSWQMPSPQGGLVSPTARPNKPTPAERLYQHQAQSPKSNLPPTTIKLTQHRRPRSEVRKCRKVYGMEHRDQWCTQCKWKKACTRFQD